MRRAAVLAGVLSTLAAAAAAGAIRVEVVRGEGSNNNGAQGSSISPVVRVTDESGAPVRDALVVFEAPTSGPSVDFGGSGPSAHGLSSETGVVAAPTIRPVAGDGPVEIRITASQGGQFANAVIHQMNLGVSGSARAQELDVVAVPRATPSEKTFTVRVEDSDGHPVALASALIVLRRVAGGKVEELDRQQGPTAENGQLSGEFPKLSASGTLEFMVRAEFDGRRATRYFPAK
jgi:protocatechuate 3,4-dioxygenase beta subunit